MVGSDHDQRSELRTFVKFRDYEAPFQSVSFLKIVSESGSGRPHPPASYLVAPVCRSRLSKRRGLLRGRVYNFAAEGPDASHVLTPETPFLQTFRPARPCSMPPFKVEQRRALSSLSPFGSRLLQGSTSRATRPPLKTWFALGERKASFRSPSLEFPSLQE